MALSPEYDANKGRSISDRNELTAATSEYVSLLYARCIRFIIQASVTFWGSPP